MARQVFFSFHFRRDAWRVGQIRNAWVVDDKGSANTILDWADWEKIEKKGEAPVKKAEAPAEKPAKKEETAGKKVKSVANQAFNPPAQ